MPSLPILTTSAGRPDDATLVRYFQQAQRSWTAHLAEEESLDFGIAWVNARLPRVHIANRLFDVALPDGTGPEQAYRTAQEHFARLGATCWQWVMNSAASVERTAPMVEYLLSHAYRAEPCDIAYLDRMTATISPGAAEQLTIIPARASFRHAQVLHGESSRRWDEPQLAEAAMLHLDDPHFDALLALKDGVAVAHAGVLAVGEIGMIEEVFVSEPFRRRGIGTTMMARVLEICARSLFKHVLLGVAPNNEPAKRLYQRLGFRKVGQLVEYQRPT
jgi:GNAT superfamily N-acetyltransferase